MRKVYCDLCGNELGDMRDLIVSDTLLEDANIFAEIQFSHEGNDVCNKCRISILNAAKGEAKKIKEEFENGEGKKDV